MLKPHVGTMLRRTPEDRESHRQQECIRRQERRQHSTASSTSMSASRQRSECVTDDVNVLDERSAAWGDNVIPQLRRVPLVTQESVLERLRGALGASGLDETVCAVCDTWVLRTHCRTIVVSEFV
ncbi:hypothetical protein PPTG_08259 [Phytophthora nicotianae INRA-310]|uniref:Uncharacterized protein n=1 Tax=Phytophthora nicotianae (strain INRA-310) TaxID=761204 RepID=W2QLM1_PHYN3|nr:hypothetical protein PPTG_08259 [Phytophthora nicotianae INRA-310]ETN13424.1 hypothetical protein PPTG_08259 [Phytophthora nicotianae INRA-310]